MKARAQKGNWGADVEIVLADKREKGYAYVTDLIITYDENNHGRVIDPTFKLSYEDAQQLMDDLWQCGLRPSEGTGSAGALAATQEHLDDMRKLVFDYITKGI